LRRTGSAGLEGVAMTPGSAAPDSSVIEPWMAPDDPPLCAQAGVPETTRPTINDGTTLIPSIGSLPFCSPRAAGAVLLEREHPDHAAFRHIRVVAHGDAVDARLHRARILAPARDHRDV